MGPLTNRITGWIALFHFLFFFVGASPILSQEPGEGENRFTVYGTIQSVGTWEKRITLVGGEVLYLTERTSIRNMAGNNVSFSQWMQPGKIIGALVEEVDGKWMAISVRESGPG